MSGMNNKKAAIIGAGMSGITLARCLAKEGWEIDLFEKSRGLGGRLSTRRGDGWQCDHGAQYFTARDASFLSEVQHWIHRGWVAPWPASIGIYQEGSFRPSTDPIQRYVGTPRMNEMLQHDLESIRIHRQLRISSMVREDKRWTLLDDAYQPVGLGFHVVLLALPAAQAGQLVHKHSTSLFQTTQSVTMTPSWAAMCTANATRDLEWDALFVNEGPLRWICHDRFKPGREGSDTWLLHATAEWSEAHWDDEPAKVGADLQNAFLALTGITTDAPHMHRWLYADIANPLMLGSVLESESGIGLCGDWLCGGKVQGAWLSGRDLANRIIS